MIDEYNEEDSLEEHHEPEDNEMEEDSLEEAVENDISNEGNGNIIFQGTQGAISLSVSGDSSDDYNDDDSTFPCPDCNTLLDASIYGKIKCTNLECGKVVFRRNLNVGILEFKNLDKEEQKLYKKTVANISNKIIDGNYRAAFQYSLAAEKIAPDEPLTWEYMALCEFLKNPVKTIKRQARNVRPHLEKAKRHGIEGDRYEEVTGDIANRLFYAVRKNCRNVRPNVNEIKNERYWMANQIKECITYLNAYEKTCYYLYKDPKFLEEAVLELSSPHKYLAINEAGVVENLEQCGTFRADRRRDQLIEKLLIIKPEYQPPALSPKRLERFRIVDEHKNSRFRIRDIN